MPAMQRTFQLVPETVAKPMSRPPMTSKAAKKAYQKANQAPRVSRAEQRRLDREAVERLNREHEREKAAAKAKAAREKKAAKANAEKEERRRKGIPEPSRFVRASQPTISRFARPGNKRTLQDMEDVEEEEDIQAEDTLADEEDAFGPIVEEVEELDNAVAMKPVATKTNMGPPAKMAMDMSSDDEFGDFPSLSQTDIFQRVDSPMPFKKEQVDSKTAQKEALDSESDDFPTLSQCDLLEKGNFPLGATTISRNCTPNLQRPSTISPSPRKDSKSSAHRTINMPPSKSMPSRNPLHSRSANTMPPPALPKLNKATSFPPPPEISRSSARQTTARGYKTPAQNAPPTSTQAFLENNLDDFFPSPSQEIRELLDGIDDIPSNTQIAMELGPVKQKSKGSNGLLGDLFPTPAVAISSRDLLDIDTPSRPPNQRMEPRRKDNRIVRQPLPRSSLGKGASRNLPNVPHAANGREESTSLARNKSSTTIAEPQMPFQPPHAESIMRPSTTTLTTPKGPQGRKESPRPYMPPQKLIQENKTHSRSQFSSQNPPPVPPKIPIPPPPKKRFFEEKEEDQLHAAMLESRREAEVAEKAHQLAQVQKNAQAQAKAKEQAQARAGQHRQQVQPKAESEAQATVLVKDSPSGKKRTLQRAQSSVTDYGDDEFNGCSQELLALCY